MPGCFLRLEFRDALPCSKPNAKNSSAEDTKVLPCKNSITFFIRFALAGIWSVLSPGFFSTGEEMGSMGSL